VWLGRVPARALPLPWLAAGCLVAWRLGAPPALPADPAEALRTTLAGEGLTEQGLAWVDPPAGWLRGFGAERRAVVLASRAEQPTDVFLLRVPTSPEGRAAGLPKLFPLSETSAAEEHQLVVEGTRVAWLVGPPGAVTHLHVVDFAGRPSAESEGWGTVKRLQDRITQWQRLGQCAGMAHASLRFEPAARSVTLALRGGALLIDHDGALDTLDPFGALPETVKGLEQVPAAAAPPPGFVQWAVDRVRALPWFGSDRMQAVKAYAFTALDRLESLSAAVTGDDGSQDVSDELGTLTPKAATFADPETGWPPPPLEPILTPALEGEGQWRTLEDDPFVVRTPNAPSPFAVTFLRPDAKRKYAQIFITLWDPRQIALDTVSGTVEPTSATGETGTGMVPRKPEVIRRLAAGINGGFQAIHGEYGMMADGIVYLPPKPFAATVARMKDGATAFGTWPKDDTIPADVVSYRQNMTPLIAGGRVNPYKRTWWGGVPADWEDKTRTARSGICLTKEGFVGYFYGSRIDSDHLAAAMLKARCEYGIHLDMNAGHTGMEFYHVAPLDELPVPNRPLDEQWEAKGNVSGAPGLGYLARRMVRMMGLMGFPRYIKRESRDFIYLTLRPVLPGAHPGTAAPNPVAEEGKWETKGLPQQGWPYAMARTTLQPDANHATKIALLRLDPRTLRPAANVETAPVVLTADPGQNRSSSLWWVGNSFVIASEPPGEGAVRLVSGSPQSTSAAAAVAVDDDGMLLYAEAPTQSAQSRADLVAAMARAGGKPALWLSDAWNVALGGDRPVRGAALPATRRRLTLVRQAVPSARSLFPETPVVPPSVWQPLQSKRLRYFKKPESTATATATEDPSSDAQ